MTSPAGQVKVGVTVDASDLTSDITKEVEKALKPALKDIDRLIGDVTKGMGQMDSKGLDKAADSARKVARELDNAADEAKKLENSTSGDKASRGMNALHNATAKAKAGLGQVHTAAKGVSQAGNDALTGLATGMMQGAGASGKMAAALGSVGAAAGVAAVGIGAVVAAAAGIAVGTKALYDMGAAWDEMSDKAQLATGLTGDALASFQGSVNKMGVTNVAAPLEDISAMAVKVRQEFRVTDGELEALTSHLMNLQTATGQGVNVDAFGKAMRQNNMTVEQSLDALNQMFAVNQNTGMSIDEMTSAATRSGGAMEELGLTFNESIALFNEFEESGLDVSAMLPGLTKAVAAMAKDGKTGKEALSGITEELKRLQATGPPGAALTKANEVFGVKSGAKFMQLINDGLDFSNLTLDLPVQDINHAVAATEDWAQHMTFLKNEMRIAMQPLATASFDAIDGALANLTDWISGHMPEIINGVKTVGNVFIDLGGIVTKIVGQIIWGVGDLVGAIGDMEGAALRAKAAWERIRPGGSDEEANKIDAQADAAFAKGEDISKVGKAMVENTDAATAAMKQTWGTLTDSIAATNTEMKAAKESLFALGPAVHELPTGHVVLTSNTQEEIDRVRDLGYNVHELEGHPGVIQVEANTPEVKAQLVELKGLVNQLPTGELAVDTNVPDVQNQLRELGYNMVAMEGHPGTFTVKANTEEVQGTLDALGDQVRQLPTGEIVLTANDTDAQAKVSALGYDLHALESDPTQVVVVANTDQADLAMGQFFDAYRNSVLNVNVQATPTYTPGDAGSLILPGGAAGGGPIWGVGNAGRKGIDSVLMYGASGEHMWTSAEVDAVGGHSRMFALRAMARAGYLRGYQDGGPIGGDPGAPVIGLSPMAADIAAGMAQALGPVLGLLTEIRDLTARDGATTAKSTESMAKGASSAADKRTLKGEDRQHAAQGAPPKGARDTGDLRGATDALVKMVETGDYKGLSKYGVLEDSPLVDALLTARDQAGAMGKVPQLADSVRALMEKGDYTGAMAQFGLPEDSKAVDALFQMRDSLLSMDANQSRLAGRAGSMQGALGGAGGGNIDQAIMSAIPAGSYSQSGSADLTQGLGDCSSAVEDLVNILDKRPTAGREMSTGNAAEWLAAHGFQQGTGGLGDMRVAFNEGHMQATLPGGTPFNWGSDAAAAQRGLGGSQGADDPALTSRWFRPVTDALGGSVGGAMKGAAGQICGCTPNPGEGANAPGFGGQLVGNMLDAAGGIATKVGGDVMSAAAGQDWTRMTPTGELTPEQALAEGSPGKAFFANAGITVPSYARAGDAANAETMEKTGDQVTAAGQSMSNSAGSVDRTVTNLDLEMSAKLDQLLSVTQQLGQVFTEEALKPLMAEAVSIGIEQLKSSVMNAIGTALGQAAAPPIADEVGQAVSSAMAQNSAGSAPPSGGGMPAVPIPVGAAPLYDEGGLWPSGTAGVNLSGSPERVLSPLQTALFDAGLYGGWNLQPQQQHYATTGGVNVNETVGAEWFGVSQVPILGMLVNVLIRVLLDVLGVEIEARDTLDEMAADTRAWRGDVATALATGQLISDTTGMMDRSTSSEEMVAAERIRILKIVLDALVEYIIQEVIKPLGKAAANAGLQAASSAVSSGMSTFPGGQAAGAAIGSIITGVGGVAVDIVAELAAAIAVSFFQVLFDIIGEALGTYFPSFGGGGLWGDLVVDPIMRVIEPLLILTAAFTAAIGSLVGGVLGAVLPFDEGGVAVGRGYIPKAVVAPERVLNPRETQAFERMVDALESGKTWRGGTQVTIHAPFTVQGSEQGGRDARDRLLRLLS